jgi:hypothetical protein
MIKPMKKTNEQLEQELEIAKQELEAMKSSQPTPVMGDMLMQEISNLNKASRVSTGGIPYKEIDDHKNIPLYTMLNKKIGPMHPANARITMERFYNAGYPLFVNPRTPEQVEEYKKTDIYKKREAARQADRSRKMGKKPMAQLEKFAKIIAKETNRSVKDLTEVVAIERP